MNNNMENQNESREMVNVKCHPILEYEVIGAETHYIEKVWIDDQNEPDGGFYTKVEKRHQKPKVIVNFYADVDIELILYAQYNDGKNAFTAVGKNQIRNTMKSVDSFDIPKQLILIGNQCIENNKTPKYICEDEELQPIECEKHGSCKNCPHYIEVKSTNDNLHR